MPTYVRTLWRPNTKATLRLQGCTKPAQLVSMVTYSPLRAQKRIGEWPTLSSQVGHLPLSQLIQFSWLLFRSGALDSGSSEANSMETEVTVDGGNLGVP